MPDKKILLVSWSILPQPGGSSVIVENLAQNFDSSELVVFGANAMLRHNQFNRGEESPTFNYFFSELHLFGRGGRYFNWFRKWRLNPLQKKIESVIQSEKIDCVIGVYPNIYYCLAACRAAWKLDIPFFSYFHNTYVENQAIKSEEAPGLQDEVFTNSEKVFVMSKGMQLFYSEKYAKYRDKFIPLVHTFNEFPGQAQFTGIPGYGKAHYKLVAIGNFNESNIEATKRIVNVLGKDDRFSLSFYTHVPTLLLHKRGINTGLIEHKGFVTPDQVFNVLQDYDICVLTHGFTGGYGEVEYKTIFPTRTIPLLLSGKPIIVHSPPGAFLTDFIKEHQCAELVDEASEPAIVNGLEKIINDESYQQQLVTNARKTAEIFYGPNVIKYLKGIISGV